MIKIMDKSMCVGCGACVQSCPLNCISLQADEEGFYYPNINKKACINCGKCEKVCPCINSLESINHNAIDVWCVKHRNNDIRFNSSSGGAFFALAEYVIHHDGVVFGVVMSEDQRSAKHVAAWSYEEIKKFQGSKYLQSDMGNAYFLVKKYLKEGNMVLFSGTPCQIKGLKLYLKEDFLNLICVEVICHGVSSPKLWSKYVEYLQEKWNADICNINFRSKRYGWKDFERNHLEKQRKQYWRFYFEDPYFRMFNSNFSLRPCCYQCRAKDGKSRADITLGDFWQVEKVYPDYNDNKGVSMVLLNSNKGKELFEMTKEEFFSINKGLNYELAKRCNSAIHKSQKYTYIRDKFYDDMNQLSFADLSQKYTPNTGKILLKKWLMKCRLWSSIEKCRAGANITPNYGMLFTYINRRKVK